MGPLKDNGKVLSLLFNMLSRLVIAFLLRSKHLSISWLRSPSAVILSHVVPGQAGLYARGEREPVIVLESW